MMFFLGMNKIEATLFLQIKLASEKNKYKIFLKPIMFKISLIIFL